MRILKYSIVLILLLFVSGLYAQITVSGKDYTVEDCVKIAAEYEQEQDYPSAAKFLNGAAFYIWEQKDYDKAIELFKRSITLNEQINNIGEIASIESSLGMIYNDKRDYTSSLSAFERALAIRIEQKEKLPILKTHINISAVLNNLLRFDESVGQLNRALKLAGEINDPDEMKACYAMLSETYDKKGDRQGSREYFYKYKALDDRVHQAREACIKASLEKIQQDLELTEAEKNTKELQLALKEKQLRDKQCQLRAIDSINKSLVKQIHDADLKMQTLEREEVINELQRQKFENKLKHERHILMFIIIIVTALLVFLIVLYSTLRRIKRLNKLLTERNEEISIKQKSLEDENRVRTKLLSILSHDLRTPLSAVCLFLQILRSKTLPPEMLDNHLIKLDASLNSSFQMLDNMLYWAKNQINGIMYNPEVINISDIIEANLEFLNTSIQNKSIEIVNNINGIIYIYADKEMLNIILRNLISNAIKFILQNGKIIISYKKDGTYAVIGISDTGVGIPESKQATIFTSQVVSQAGTAKETGSGLGLVLVRDFVKINKGKISFESRENVGTTFYLSLPLSNMEQLKQKAK
ncbi:MAG: tetratricopeptide repeat-containing sensor histidine kinase [Prevotellaceae bacterium]|jgi:signal transduction histidine kinase|nr:tetratricopeptide repeat-containing sensor histidine kinase [Prevotellaceae bacterium]